MSRIRLNRVGKRFGESWVIRDLDLDIQEGELVSIVGGSGCGKTTTLRIIAGFETPTEGEVWLGERRVEGVPVQDRGVGIVFQSYALFPTMSVARNVGFGLEMARVPLAERERRVKEMLDLAHLAPLADRYPWQLSGGQQQRVALARALAVAPKVLLLDEPLSALDAKIRLSLRAEIRRIQQALHLTAVYVTHDQEEALAIADHIVVMDKGRIAQMGTARDVYDHPASPFVADFIGTSNTFEGVWIGPGQARVGGEVWRLPGGGQGGVKVAVRPERLRLSLGAAAPEGNTLSGTLGVRTFLGNVWRVEVEQGGATYLVDVPRHEERALMEAPLGAPVWVSFGEADARVFGVGG